MDRVFSVPTWAAGADLGRTKTAPRRPDIAQRLAEKGSEFGSAPCARALVRMRLLPPSPIERLTSSNNCHAGTIFLLLNHSARRIRRGCLARSPSSALSSARSAWSRSAAALPVSSVRRCCSGCFDSQSRQKRFANVENNRLAPRAASSAVCHRKSLKIRRGSYPCGIDTRQFAP
jgi:hypothetical protein